MAAIEKGHARVAFDELAWQEDLRAARGSATRIARESRARLERQGQAVKELLACEEEGHDGTSLPDCVKVYLPPPAGPLGIVYRIAKDEAGRLYLDHLAFGMRHPPRQAKARRSAKKKESVYEIAHRRLHAAGPKDQGEGGD